MIKVENEWSQKTAGGSLIKGRKCSIHIMFLPAFGHFLPSLLFHLLIFGHFLPSVILPSVVFYLRSFSSFNYSTFGHFLPLVVLPPDILRSVFLRSVILRSVILSSATVSHHFVAVSPWSRWPPTQQFTNAELTKVAFIRKLTGPGVWVEERQFSSGRRRLAQRTSSDTGLQSTVQYSSVDSSGK
jgi:hypothetical protein